MVLRSMHRALTLWNRSRVVSLRARLPWRDPRIAPRTCNQQVDEQALFSLKNGEFNLQMICRRASDRRILRKPAGIPLQWPKEEAQDCEVFIKSAIFEGS